MAIWWQVWFAHWDFGETPEETLKRKLSEEIEINLKECELTDTDSTNFDWVYNNEHFKWPHIEIVYKILNNIDNIRMIDKYNNIWQNLVKKIKK